MKNIGFSLVLAAALLAMVAIGDSNYFNCECFYGTVITSSAPTCTCDCSGATLNDGQAAVGNYCAYAKYGQVELSVVTTSTNSSLFSGTSLELSLQRVFGVTGNATALSYVKIDDSDRSLTQHFTPNIVAVFAVENGTLASTILSYAKDDALYTAHLQPLGIQEVEVFFLEAGPVSGLESIAVVWIIMPVVAVFIAIIECCFAKSLKPKTQSQKTV